MSDDTTDDTNIPEEDEDIETREPLQIPSMAEISGSNSCFLFRYPNAPYAPIDHIKGCVGVSIYSKPGTQVPDDIKFLVMVGDGFRLLDITECLNINSNKEYDARPNLKLIN